MNYVLRTLTCSTHHPWDKTTANNSPPWALRHGCFPGVASSGGIWGNIIKWSQVELNHAIKKPGVLKTNA